MKHLLTASIFFITLIVFGLNQGCGKKDSASDESSGGLSIVVPASVNMTEPLVARVNEPDKVRGYHWSLTDSDEVPQLGCDSFNSAEVTCIFEFPGTINIALTAKTRSGENVLLKASVDVTDPSAPSNQAPIIMLNIAEAGELVSTVATFRSHEKGSITVPEGSEVTFDFSETTDPQDDVSSLTFEMDLGQGWQNVGMVSTHTFPEVDIYPVKVRVTDAAGNETSKAFNVFVRCDDANIAPITIDPDKIVITADPIFNYFNYSIDTSGVAGGKGTEDYRFIWDFNGDGTFDNEWATETDMREYTIFAGMRDVQLKVWDPACNFFNKVNLGEGSPEREEFEIPMADGVPGTPQRPQIGDDYWFIQAEIAGRDGNEEKSANADFISTWKQGDAPKRVICDYKKLWPGMENFEAMEGSNLATFEIKGLNSYDWPGHEGVKHGMVLKITDINDTTGTVSSGSVAADGSITLPATGDLRRAQYFTDENSDSITRRTYSKVGACDFSMVIKAFPPGPGTCKDVPDYGYPVEIDGTFSCPDLKTSDGRHVSATKGAFFCEVAAVDACPVCVGDCPCVEGDCNGGGLPDVPK